MKKLVICGTAPSWQLAPFNDPEYEIWILNDMYSYIPRYDVLFEIHEINHLRKFYIRNSVTKKCHLDEMAKLTKPIYMQQHHEAIPASIEYPLNEIQEEFGGYFTNTISYMLALAIKHGYDHISLFGVNMAGDTEYNTQRPSCEYFIGLARGQGIEIYIPEQSDLLKTAFLYGYEDIKCDFLTTKFREREKHLTSELEKAQENLKAYERLVLQYDGALQDLKHTMKFI